jgi:hypothetical protein
LKNAKEFLSMVEKDKLELMMENAVDATKKKLKI